MATTYVCDCLCFFFFQAEDGIRDYKVTGVQTCALPSAEALDGGIMVTASHNPPDYNGMKFVRQEARPISADTGLQDMRRLIETGKLPPKAARPGTERPLDVRGKYLEHLLSYVDRAKLRKLKVVVNPGNGGGGGIIRPAQPPPPLRVRQGETQTPR